MFAIVRMDVAAENLQPNFLLAEVLAVFVSAGTEERALAGYGKEKALSDLR
ncbi:hypothetical protein [Ralstonia sp. RL]|uniref:hypothetical protein n=1 Tax=Ralstonia sp. RL TaxID=1839756 RepID=UPI00257C9009|nr:hypothetical protein [Ralstonia sp. RL]